MEIIDARDIEGGFPAELIGLAVVLGTGLHAGSGEDAGEAAGVVIATGRTFLESGHAAKLGGPEHDGVVEESALLEVLEEGGIHLDAMRLCAFPFPDSVPKFIAAHDKVFVVEQNCDAQMRAMLVNELEINPAQLVKVLHYDGTPITARYITRAIRDTLQPAAADSQKEAA